MEYRIDPVPGIEEGGRLSVRGPNVMLGYLRAENPGVLEPVVDGWYDTGDIVTIDSAGFIAIKGRAKRFAKIAGEMVSLTTTEAMAAKIWPQATSVAVSIPDQRKGERIVLLTTQKDAERTAMQLQARASGASELAVPAAIQIVDNSLAGFGEDRLRRRDSAGEGHRDDCGTRCRVRKTLPRFMTCGSMSWRNIACRNRPG